MKKIIKTGMALTLLAALILSCNKHSIKGSGRTILEQRTVGAFTNVQSNSDIKLFISYGATQKIEVKGYENLVPATETYIENNRLNIRYKDKYHNVRNSNVEVYIVIPVLEFAGTNGSGNIAINGFMNGTRLAAYVNGSSNIYISNSKYQHVNFTINGSGDIKASGLTTGIAEATIFGSGDIETSCSQHLSARIYGSGDIRYWGNPTLDVAISGSGSVRKQ